MSSVTIPRQPAQRVHYQSAECTGTEQRLQDCNLTRGTRGSRNCRNVPFVICSILELATTVQLEQRYVLNENDPDGLLCLSVSGTFNTAIVLQFQASDGTASGEYMDITAHCVNVLACIWTRCVLEVFLNLNFRRH